VAKPWDELMKRRCVSVRHDSSSDARAGHQGSWRGKALGQGPALLKRLAAKPRAKLIAQVPIKRRYLDFLFFNGVCGTTFNE
jgi:hypothetical protein